MTNLTPSMAIDYGPEGVLVNAICPGPNRTGLIAMSDSEYGIEDRQADKVIAPFVSDPEEVANATVYLAPDGAQYVMGHNLLDDDGFTAQWRGRDADMLQQIS